VRVLGLIPARGGSKGIPGKNLVPLLGRPLIEWTLDAARESRELTDVVVSTDAEGIADVAARAGARVLRRPAELAADETPMRDVVLHALDELEECDVVVLLQPTSPLRRAQHVDEATVLLRETGADAVVSVVEVPHRYVPQSLMQMIDGRLVALEGDVPSRRQDKAVLYARNGPAVLAVRSESARRHATLFGEVCRPYVMSPADSVDVDEPSDLELAEFLLARRRADR
jgi:CMP-N-acetylneuraminic acid synthetase